MRNLVYVAESIIQHPAIIHMDYSKIRDALQEYFKAERERVKERIAKLGQLQKHEIAMYRHGKARAKEALTQDDLSDIGNDGNLTIIMESQNLAIDKADPAYVTFQSEYVKAYRDYCDSILEYNSRFDGFQFKTNPQAMAMQKAIKKVSKKQIGECIDDFVEEKVRYNKWTPASAVDFKAQLDLLSEYLGKDASINISKDTALDIKRMLEHIPQRARSLPVYKCKSIPELIEIKDAKRMSARTISKYLRTYTAFMDWAIKLGHTSENNFKDLAPRLQNTEQSRDDFTDEQINRMKEEAIHNRNGLIRKDYQKWGILIAIYTGARLNEIAQLTVDDVKQIDGIWCFSFNDEEGKTLKNPYSKRNVPIHSCLIECGILKLVDDVRRSGKTRLLYELSRADARNGYGRNLSRWFNERFLVKLDIKTDRLVFHSFRHTVIARLLQAGVDDPIVKTICGHSKGKDVTQRVYAKGYKASQLQQAIEKLSF